MTAAFGGSDGGDDLVVAAAGVAAQVGASLRVASFAVRPRTILTAGVGSRAEEGVVREWVEQHRGGAARGAARRSRDAAVARRVGSRPSSAHGHDWDEALEDVEWRDGDVLVGGLQRRGAVARVFLGSNATKIVRHSPVPVVVVPRGAIGELAEQAVRTEA